MLVDIANEQSLTEDVLVVIGNASVDENVLTKFMPNVAINQIGRPIGSRNPWFIAKLFYSLRAFGPDIIHAHQESFINVTKWLRVPKVLTVHNTGIALSGSLKHYDAVFSISRAVMDDINSRYPGTPVIPVYNGIVCADIQKKLTYGSRPFKIVQVGRLDHLQKGQDILLESVAKIIRANNGARITVDFIGEGASKERLVDMAVKLGIESQCTFLGKRTREYIYENLQSYDLLVQPSRFEGFGLTVVEAMAAKVPVLVSNIEGPMEIIQNGKYGYFFRTEDNNDCAVQILKIIDASRQDKFSEKQDVIRRYVEETYDIKITARNYLDEYMKLFN